MENRSLFYLYLLILAVVGQILSAPLATIAHRLIIPAIPTQPLYLLESNTSTDIADACRILSIQYLEVSHKQELDYSKNQVEKLLDLNIEFLQPNIEGQRQSSTFPKILDNFYTSILIFKNSSIVLLN